MQNIWSMGRMWLVKAFLVAHKSFLNCRKCCKSSTSTSNCHSI